MGCRLSLRFPVAKLTDWAGSLAQLEDSRNPFAILTQTHLATRSTRHDPNARYEAKWTLVKRLYQCGFDRPQVAELFRMIDWMMQLPAEHEQRLQHDLLQFEEEMNMRYVTSIERLALKKGLEQGMQCGRRAGKAEVIARQLEVRFGPLPEWATARLAAATEEQLDAWTEGLMQEDSLETILSPRAH